ncbi:MAG: helix-turn-helix domain-containing protein [Lachnospiraceae bacterium]|nr:helix-turn-helix domain-containing protein [Lachnospiraceae bacterium]
MDFGTRIKTIRKEQKLTQEQLAEQLDVTRQAVSNWENNRNLPDIEILIRISDVFHISLDELIKGEQDMTEKIIKDGSETRKARFNMIILGIGAGLILLGILLILIKGASVEYIDADGFLHENFFLLPMGFLSMFCGLLAFLIAGVKNLIERLKNK